MKLPIAILLLLCVFAELSALSQPVWIGIQNQSNKDIRLASLVVKAAKNQPYKPLFIGSLGATSPTVWINVECSDEMVVGPLFGIIEGSDRTLLPTLPPGGDGDFIPAPFTLKANNYLLTIDENGHLHANPVEAVTDHRPFIVQSVIEDVLISSCLTIKAMSAHCEKWESSVTIAEERILLSQLAANMDQMEVPTGCSEVPECSSCYRTAFRSGLLSCVFKGIPDDEFSHIEIAKFLILEKFNDGTLRDAISDGFDAGRRIGLKSLSKTAAPKDSK